MCKVVQEFLGGAATPDSLIEAIIVMIPKVSSPELLSQFQPISLCNVLYKIASKVISNRLKLILPDIISEEQSAFVSGRIITDNILLAYEVVHYLRNNKKGKDGFAAIKLDMSKAYDRVEWPFLKAMMEKLGFDRDWIKLIMKCITTVK